MRGSDITNPIINLAVWLIAILIALTSVILGWSFLSNIASAVFDAPTPLVGRIAAGIGLGFVALILLLFFVWLVKLLVRDAVVYVIKGREP